MSNVVIVLITIHQPQSPQYRIGNMDAAVRGRVGRMRYQEHLHNDGYNSRGIGHEQFEQQTKILGDASWQIVNLVTVAAASNSNPGPCRYSSVAPTSVQQRGQRTRSIRRVSYASPVRGRTCPRNGG